MKDPSKKVFLAVREVPRRFMGTRVEPKCEAELRELIGNRYISRARLFRETRAATREAARELATRRGWTVEDEIGWVIRVVNPEADVPARRTAQVDLGLITIASIISTSRRDGLEYDDPSETAAINAALSWIARTSEKKA